MSRLAKKPIPVPEKVEVSVSGGSIVVSGPAGKLSRSISGPVKVAVDSGFIQIAPTDKTLHARAMLGTTASHIKNMLAGARQAFSKKLIIEGIGFKSEVKGKELVLSVGFSHPVKLPIPEGLSVTAEKNVITVSGSDKELVGRFSAVVRDQKKPEPYKGKGIRYEREVIRRKEGKKTV
jgi:large subunit ribosomal protein L6